MLYDLQYLRLKLISLSDIFRHLNKLDEKLQGSVGSISKELIAFQKIVMMGALGGAENQLPLDLKISASPTR